MRLLTYSIGFLLLAILFKACNNADSGSQAQQKPVITATPYADGARRVTIEELEALVKDGKAFVVDVRSQDAYNVSHIPGAKLIPYDEIVNHINELPRDKIVVTYCS
jgi:3-mercaptopyruvate sulfurtransferase SseA